MFKNPKDKLDMVLGQLLGALPFYGRAAMYLQWEIKDDLNPKTAATDFKTVFFHPDFLMSKTDEELLYVATHEIQHVIKKHHLMKQDRDNLIWNIACDHAINNEINTYIKKDNVRHLKPPEDILCSDKYAGWLEQDIYEDLIKDTQVKFMQNSTGMFDGGDPSSIEQAEANRNIDRMIEASAKAARDAGKLPGFLENFLAINRRHQVNWRTKLRRFFSPIFPTLISWEKFNKRAISLGYYLPGLQKDGVGNLAILIDTSGSIRKNELDAFVAELNYIINEMHPSNVQVIWFESSPWLIQKINQGESIKVPEKIQSGGTSFANAFSAITNNPKAVIVLTDMEDSFNFKEPRAKTIWVATTEKKAPWGETVKIDA